MLGCPKELKKIKAEGISFGNAVHWARRAGAEVEAFQTSQTDVDFFRQSVKKCCSSDNCHLVSSYHRAGLEQTGAGHFSPIGGYHAGSDMVLILDVARFKYRPHWVPLTLLWEAMDTVNKTTGQRRGFMLISKPKRDAGMLYTLSRKNESWVGVVKYLMDDVPHLLKSKDVKDINGILGILLASPPSGFGKFIQSVAEVKREQECGIGISEEEKQRLASREELLKQVRDTGFFEYVVNFLPSTSCCSRVPGFGGSENLDEIAASVCSHGAEPDPNNCSSTQPVGSNILTVLLLMLSPETWCGIKDEKLREEVRSLVSMDSLPAMLQREVLHLRRQLYDLKKREENMANMANMAKRKSAVAQKKSAFAHGLSPQNWIVIAIISAFIAQFLSRNIRRNIRRDLLLLRRNLPLPMVSLRETGL
ncbi:hypothetical protein EUGRSUZ_L01653 [Eucalyptus grandis]|uniref:glutathione gamma-glutamylcysteinyltransferase n=1 Tax=Eucalyptus grandis TaxID=71139 RepID=A0A058ZSK9_EUCGR|nr:hypothetical protein EUGRSUZ_L01653 [Eucalyptus grandis]